ncbi:MAG TPA: tRNA pseudouridine(38-40) synthase TruA [Nitriliruptorales bacterium]|nr:tRNA pseudouridine(38-40) synthase TruA [Nitriliruptorales bacterium]
MPRLRIDLAYDGGPFHGFARQPDVATVQGTLEDALSRLLGQAVDTTGAGRTDRGVHALAQVVHLDVDETGAAARRQLADLPRLRARLDRLVGDAVVIWRVDRVGSGFHARFSATQRRYHYRIAADALVVPLRRFDVWRLRQPLRVEPMRIAAGHLTGEHDFASLCRAIAGRSTVRRIDRLTVTRERDGLVHVRVAGPAFCHQQVRSLVGVLVEVGRGRRPPGWAADVLAARDRAAAASVAPAHGLTLERVSYGRGYPAAPPPGALPPT